MEELKSFVDTNKINELLIEKLGNIIPNIIGAIILLIVGIWLSRFVRRVVKNIMIRREVDITVQNFVNQLIRWLLYIVLFLAVIQKLGVPASSFLGALTASAVAIGLALQGSLSNFAGGIMLLILKPFKIGDVIEAKGQTGTVQSVGMFYTTMNKFGNELVIIPNGPLFADNIINYTREEKRRVKVMVGISYDSDIKTAKQLLLDIANACPTSLQDPVAVVFVEELADSSVNLSVRVWTSSPDYWNTYFYLIENIKLEFDKAGINIPFPQREMRIINT